MATAIIKYAGKKYGRAQVIKGFNSDDLYFETIVTESRSGKTKEKKVKKRMPDGLTPDEEALLKRAKKSAWRLDMGLINLMGIRFGWSAIVGIVPGFGDLIDFLLAVQLYKMCCELEPPLLPKKRNIMKLNILLDAFIGLVPFLGDIADGIYKCNTRNVSILEAELEKRGRARITERQAGVARLENEERRNHGGPPPSYTPHRKPTRPEPAHGSKSGGIRGWFGGRKEQDIESGNNLPMAQPATVNASQSRANRY